MNEEIRKQVAEMKKGMSKLERNAVLYRLSTPQDIGLQTEEEIDYFHNITSFPAGLKAYNSAMDKMTEILINFDLKNYQNLKPYLVEAFPGDYSNVEKRKEKV